MVYAIVIYPDLNDDFKIQSLRKKYDSQFNLIKPHITLVFPFPDVDRNKLKKHAIGVIEKLKTFEISLDGIEKSKDNYSFLLVKDGKDKIKEMHDALYSGIIKKYYKKRLKYVPHITLGIFTKENSYQFESGIKKLNLNHKCKINRINIIHIRKALPKIDWSYEIRLKDGKK